MSDEENEQRATLHYARETFLQTLTWEELQLLRASVRRTLLGGRKTINDLTSDRQVDAVIESMGPIAAQERLKNIVDSKRKNDFHRREYFI